MQLMYGLMLIRTKEIIKLTETMIEIEHMDMDIGSG